MRTLCVIALTAATLINFVYGASRRPATSNSQNKEFDAGYNAPGQRAPDFELKSLDGRTIKLSDFRGKAVVLNFWATYCAPCRVEMPWLIDFYQRYKSQGLEIVGISMDDGNQKQVDAFAREMNVNYAILLGNHSVRDAYGGARFLPQTFLVDRDGRIVKTLIGIKTRKDFEDSIKQLLATQSQTPLLFAPLKGPVNHQFNKP